MPLRPRPLVLQPELNIRAVKFPQQLERCHRFAGIDRKHIFLVLGVLDLRPTGSPIFRFLLPLSCCKQVWSHDERLKMAKTTDTEAHKKFCEEFVAAREKQGITQTAVAERLGVHQSLIARIESGNRRVDIIEYIALCRAAGVDPASFLGSFSASVTPDHQIGEDKRR